MCQVSRHRREEDHGNRFGGRSFMPPCGWQRPSASGLRRLKVDPQCGWTRWPGIPGRRLRGGRRPRRRRRSGDAQAPRSLPGTGPRRCHGRRQRTRRARHGVVHPVARDASRRDHAPDGLLVGPARPQGRSGSGRYNRDHGHRAERAEPGLLVGRRRLPAESGRPGGTSRRDGTPSTPGGTRVRYLSSTTMPIRTSACRHGSSGRAGG